MTAVDGPLINVAELCHVENLYESKYSCLTPMPIYMYTLHLYCEGLNLTN